MISTLFLRDILFDTICESREPPLEKRALASLAGGRRVFVFGSLTVLTALSVSTYHRDCFPSLNIQFQLNQLKSFSTISNDGYLFDPEGGIRRSLITKESDLPWLLDERLTTVHDLLLESVRLSGQKPFLGSHSTPSEAYSWITFKAVYERVCDLGSGLINVCGLKSHECGNFLGIFGRNCADWVVAEFACATYGLVAVPLYDTLGTEALKHICNHSELTVCICVTPDLVQKLLDLNPALLRHIILIQSDEGTLKKLRETAGGRVQIHDFADILIKGKEEPRTPDPSGTEEWVFICYTSGTTGTPKGVIITNKMLIATVTGTMMNTNCTLFTQNDVHLSFLPLAHIFEQFNVMLALNARGRIGFYSGDIVKLQEDAHTLQPTILIAVPRVLARIRQRIYQQVADSRLKTRLIETAINQKLKSVDKQIYKHNTMWDQLVFSKIRKRFGGRIRLIITAGAPISGELLQFIRAAFCCPVFEGYGSTETCGAITSAIFGDLEGGHVGPPLPGCEIKLVDIPDMGLVAARDNKGEICCRGPVVTLGYFKEPGLTAQALDKEGWLHMGDVGVWCEGNRLKIVDRLKHIFKLSQGEYVAPEKIEEVYLQAPLVCQVFVDGSPLRSYPVALVVPDGDALCRALTDLEQDLGSSSTRKLSRQSKNRPPEGDTEASEKFCLKGKMVTLADICNSYEAERLVYNELTQVGKSAGLKGFEQVRAIKLVPEAFSLENRLLTPTMKCARHAIRQRYQEDLLQLFARKELD
ncbi:long chain fatty acid coenzyme A ligase 1 [Echinococcus multilocularis]|uniref:long-chain-fatty-acid--CoA ligase n=1 Tax=Echinococcus multilocularis TaxID=6211 RepID=A0A068Y8I0_ECHMU|nr:long chain fatty acid coenzyme A ligase 1 [Echinococcus multilocularis]